MFTGNTNIGMAPRALTAADVVYSEQRAMSRPGFAAAFSWLTSTQATGNYTVVWTCSSFYTNWAWRLGGTALGQIWASEVVNAAAQGGPDNWKNACGSGPFILTSYIQGSEAGIHQKSQLLGFYHNQWTVLSGTVHSETGLPDYPRYFHSDRRG